MIIIVVVKYDDHYLMLDRSSCQVYNLRLNYQEIFPESDRQIALVFSDSQRASVFFADEIRIDGKWS